MTAVPDFEALYRGEPDPWRVGSSFYEQRKLALVLGALSRPGTSTPGIRPPVPGIWRPGWRPAAAGCSPPTVPPRPSRSPGRPAPAWTTCIVRRLALPEVESVAAEGPFDLVVVSEFLYYLTDRDRAAALVGFEHLTGAGAELVAVHWRQHPHDAWLSGAALQAEVSETLLGHGWQPGVRLRIRSSY